MDRSLFERAVKWHGSELDRCVKEEHGASFLDDETATTENVTSAPNDGKNTSKCKDSTLKRGSKDAGGHFTLRMHDFIARKADILFRKNPDDVATPLSENPSVKDAENSDYYAILPPLEQFLGIEPDDCQERLFELLRVGDVVLGRILSTKEFGIFVKLLALHRDVLQRFLEECEVVALLPSAELRDKFSHVASVDDFQVGDLVRALVIKVEAEEQKVIISLHAREDSKANVTLGLITQSDLPVYYRRSLLQIDNQETYGEMLENSVGFDNPSNVTYLGGRLGLSDDCPLSLMRGLQRGNFPEKEFAEPLRKWQTNRWSMESVAKGVEFFKAGNFLDAIHHLNKALEIDEENVEALVARGALHANRDLLSKALEDFSRALKLNPSHRNANKYMCQTLIEKGKQFEDSGKTEKAGECYQTALDINPQFLEAQLCLNMIVTTRTPKKRAASPESISTASPTSPTVTHISAEALRQMVEPGNFHLSQPKKSSEKSKKKKKKKKKEREKDKTSKKLKDGGHSARSKSKKRRRIYSRSYSSASSESRSRNEKKSSSKRRRNSASFSRSSDSSLSIRSSKQGSSKRKSFDKTKRSHKYRSPERNLQDDYHTRSRSQSPYSISGRSYSSCSPDVDRRRSRSKSHDGKSMKIARNKERSSRKQTGTARLNSPSSPSSRRRMLSKDSSSRSSKIDTLKKSNKKDGTVLDMQEKVKASVRSRSKSDTKRSVEHLPSPDASPIDDEELNSKQRKIQSVIEPNIIPKRFEKGKNKLEMRDEFDKKRQKEESKHRQEILKKLSETSEREESKKYGAKTRRQSYSSDTESDSDNTNKGPTNRQSKTATSGLSSMKSTSDKVKKGSKDRSSPRDSKTKRGRNTNGKRKCRSHSESRSRSRSYSSIDSYSSGSYLSVSGSRSYSYSSYSSYTNSTSSYSGESDDSYYQRKRSGSKSRRNSKRSNKASRKAHPKVQDDQVSRKGNIHRDSGRELEEDDDSDFDTDIYEISRGHLEMYLDSKSYRKTDDGSNTPLKMKKQRQRSKDEQDTKEDENKLDKKGKSLKRRHKEESDDENEKATPVFSPAAYKEPQKLPKPIKTFPELKQVIETSKEDIPENIDTPIPSPVAPAMNQDFVQFDKEALQESYTRSSVSPTHLYPQIVPQKSNNPLIVPSVEPHQLIFPSASHRQTITSDIIPHHQPINPNYIKSEQQITPTELNQSTILGTKIAVPNVPLKLDLEKRVSPLKTSGPVLQHQEMFTPAQLAVIQSISKQLGQVPPVPSCSEDVEHFEKALDSDKLRHGRGNHRGHQIGVIVTHRSSDEMQPERSDLSPTDNQTVADPGQWDIPEHSRKNVMPLEVGNQVPVSFDYKHGQHMTSNQDKDGESCKNLSGSEHSGIGEFSKTHDIVRTNWQIPRLNKENTDLPRSKSHHRSGGERSHGGDRHMGERSESRRDYYSTSSDGKSIMDASHEQGHGQSTTNIKVIDYQHGQGDRHPERHHGRTKVSDKSESRHRDDNPRRWSHDRPRERSDCRDNTYDRRHGDEQHGQYRHHDTDRGSYRHRSSETHHEGTHSRSRDRHTESTRAFEPKESNPFSKLVSSSKEMQVASLHSEGKWGYSLGPEEDVQSSSSSSGRKWWL